MRDGRAIFSRRVLPPPLIERAAWAKLFGENGSAAFGRRGGPLDRPPAPGDAPGRRSFGRRDVRMADGGLGRADRPRGSGGPPDRGIAYDFATVTVGGQDVGVVAVPVEPPPLSVAMQNLGPELLTVALGLLVAGTAIGALLVFRPTHRRLQALQESARAVGSGATGVRAPETGGDEVTALARAFNEMAGQLEQRTQALEAIDRTRRQLVADVSHELTTPLAAIRGYVETLSMPEVSLNDDTRARYLKIVSDETDRLEHIIGDLLDVARLEGGGGTLAIEDVPVAQLFERLRPRHKQVLDQKSITLQTSEPTPGLIVRGDPKRLEQAVQNLVANATRHTPAGGCIIVSATEKADGVVLAVEDTGPGIPAEHLPRVFDRFYKVDVSRTGTAWPSGSGLGLSIVRAIVERHGGTITASNASSGGARFEIRLPEAR
jgi:two-component system sensor histidine kinase BaeS